MTRLTVALVAATLGLMMALPTHAQAPKGKGKGKTTQTQKAPAGASAGYVRWSDPAEGSFSTEVPRGWKVTGGLTRVGPLGIRQTVMAIAPDESSTIMLGSSDVPTFSTLGQWRQQQGMREGMTEEVPGVGKTIYMHYMSALEFNRLFLEKGVATAVDNLQIVVEKDMPEAAARAQAQTQRNFNNPQARVSMAITAFSAVDRKTGKKIGGFVSTNTTLLGDENGRYGAGWTVIPNMVVSWDDGNPQRIPNNIATFEHMLQTWHNNPVWQKKESIRSAQVMRDQKERNQRDLQTALANLRRNAPRGGGAAGAGGAGRADSSMDAFRRRQAALDDVAHQSQVRLRGKREVVGSDGKIYEVDNE